MVRDHRLLHGVEAEAFDGDDAGAVHLRESQNAGIDGLEVFVSGAADKDRASPAVAFLANDLGSRCAELIPQPGRERSEDLASAGAMFAAIDRKDDVVAHSCSLS